MQWDNEHNGLDLRHALKIELEALLPHERAFSLLPDVSVVPHGEIPLAQVYVDHLRGVASARWSGIGIPLPDGGALVVFNDSHTFTRIRATLMEEFFHLWLGHPATRVRVYLQNDSHRTHDPRIESEAFGSGAAALVPYCPLRRMVEEGISVGGIARTFAVSRELVLFRAKVTKLYGRLRTRADRGHC